MRNFKTLALSTAAIAGLSISAAHADMGANFTSHHLVDEKPYDAHMRNLPAEDKLEIREYLNYEQREPCQFYQPIPEGFMRDGCDIVRKAPMRQTKAQPVQQKRTVKREVLADYEINFAFDSAAIEPAAGNVLDQIAREIKTHKPGEVTVAGHADRAGPSDYNVSLSKERAQAVSDALHNRGVANRVLDAEAYGESNPEVPTPDGVPHGENRRVEIQFLK